MIIIQMFNGTAESTIAKNILNVSHCSLNIMKTIESESGKYNDKNNIKMTFSLKFV